MQLQSPQYNTVPAGDRWLKVVSDSLYPLRSYVKYVILVALLCPWSESTFACQNFKVYGLIGDAYYKKERGPAGPLGCPLSDEKDTARTLGHGRYNEFEHGEIVYSPDVWPRGVTYAYVHGNDVYVAWTDTSPFSYDYFIVRWDKADPQHDPGAHPTNHENRGQEDIHSGGTNGSFHFVATERGRYRIVVEGCDTRFANSSACRQGWTIPIFVNIGANYDVTRGDSPPHFIRGKFSCTGDLHATLDPRKGLICTSSCGHAHQPACHTKYRVRGGVSSRYRCFDHSKLYATGPAIPENCMCIANTRTDKETDVSDNSGFCISSGPPDGSDVDPPDCDDCGTLPTLSPGNLRRR
ncbi:MAG: hypothetical protein CV088_01040 [Nitrospira sp. LK70]|nr:hypothetical protein [Nitrospira sp. LK70]